MTRTIAHRDLRNNSAEVLRAVRDGETVQVTNHGEVVAVLSPPPVPPLGNIRHRPALIRGGFADLPRFTIAESTESALEALRAER
ncbi:type II toxin-antitoxin system prevent-host-death family antitoxin [Cryobacterium frigoriphilum]|uniref:Type II toxin-antitoxin system prevent-host-death family antitoxin n=1 Tax=Cryobacterium frigoriphilum TaxID=1259150 RepID=A0A4R9A1G3_9MICO|nr:type II toxin-antitoxin system prevent-host-death family antitoxin [Cryobacterium frigoriphilum]TFD50259.1 type II toxin-antitoxin system prevent-host-death family antitoxin [Cryobacterium frigoriphilum]